MQSSKVFTEGRAVDFKDPSPWFPTSSLGGRVKPPKFSFKEPLEKTFKIGRVPVTMKDGKVVYEVPFEISIEKRVIEGKATQVQAFVEVEYE